MNAEANPFQLPDDPAVLEAMRQAGPAATCRYPGCTRPRYQGDATNPYHCCLRHRRLLRMSQYAESAAVRLGSFPSVPPAPLSEATAPEKHEYPTVLNAQGVAELLGVSTALVLRLAREGKLPGKKVGSTWRFLRSRILEWLSSVEPADPTEL